MGMYAGWEFSIEITLGHIDASKGFAMGRHSAWEFSIEITTGCNHALGGIFVGEAFRPGILDRNH